MTRVLGVRHAVFAVDPGRTSGLFCGAVELGETIAETLATITMAKAGEVKEEDSIGSGVEIGRAIIRWAMFCEKHAIGAPNRHVVAEDFQLRRRQEGGATGILDSCWVGGAIGGFVDGVEPIEWQQPSDAKTYATDERLKRWGLYGYSLKPASVHKRDAIRHFALKVNTLLG